MKSATSPSSARAAAPENCANVMDALEAALWRLPPGEGKPPFQEPIRVATVVEEVYGRLAAGIALGHVEAGGRLPTERTLAAQLGVARSSVRAAVRRLCDENLVEVRRGRFGGTFVIHTWVPSSAQSIEQVFTTRWSEWEHLFDLRARTEAMVARTAAERVSAEHRRLFRSALRAFQLAQHPDEIRTADARLHEAVAEATGNPYLVGLSAALRRRVNLGFPVDPFRPHSHVQALRQHGELVEAVLRHQSEDAGRLASEHFLITESAVRELLAEVSPLS